MTEKDMLMLELEAEAAAASAPQAEAPKEEGGFMRFMNKGMAETLGAPVDLISAGLNAVGINTGDSPWGGSQNIRQGMRNIGAPTPNRGPETTSEFMGLGVGEGAGMAVPFGGLVNKIAKAPGLFGGLARTGQKRLLKTGGPVIAAGAGLAGGMGAGAARQQAERADLGPTQTMLAEMAGGLAATTGSGAALKLAMKTPGLRILKGFAQRAATPFFDEPAWQQASDIMRSKFDDPLDAINQVKAAKGTNMMASTATENPGALGLAQTVMDMNPALKERLSKQASDSVQSLAESIKGTGRPKSTREFIYQKRQTLFRAMEARVEMAASKAKSAIEQVKATLADAKVIVAKAMREAEADVILQRKALWDGVDQSIKIPVKRTVAAYNEVLSQLSPVNEKNLPQGVRDIIGPVANTGHRGLGSSPITHTTLKDAYALYKELGQQADNALSTQGGKQNRHKAAILLELQDAVMEDMETMGGAHSDLRTAIDFSKMEINTFRKGPVGAMLGYQGSKWGEPLADSLMLEKTLVKGEEGSLARGRIQSAAKEGDMARTAMGQVSPSGSASVNVAEGMQDYLKQEFVKYATKDGIVDPNAARLFLRDRAELMDSFPTLKKQLEAARKTEDVSRRVMSETDGQRKRFDKKEVSKTAQLLGGPLDVQVGKIMASEDPTQGMREAVKIVKRDPTGEALKGLQAGFGQFLIKDITTSKTDLSGKLILDGIRLRANLKMDEFMGPIKALYSPEQIKGIEEMADQLAKFQIQQQHNKAVPLLGGTTSWLIDFTSGIVGAKFGRALNTGTIQVPGKTASLAVKFARFLTTNKVEQVLSDAIMDHDLMIALLRGKGTAQGERVLRSWMVGTGARLFEDDESTEN